MKKEMEKLDQTLVAGFGPVNLAMDMFHLEKDDLIDEIEDVITIGQFYDRANTENTHIVFV